METYEQENAVDMKKILNQEFSNVICIKLCEELEEIDGNIREVKKTLEKYNELIEANHKEITEAAVFSQKALDGLKAANWKFDEEVFGNLEKTPQIVVEKFLIMLSISENASPQLGFVQVKNIMNAFQPEALKTSEIDDFFIIYNSRDVFRRYPNSDIIVDWISSALEYKIYRDSLIDLKKKSPKLHAKVQSKIASISKLEKEKSLIHKSIIDIQKCLHSAKSISANPTENFLKTRTNSDAKSHSNSRTILSSSSFPDLRMDTDQLYKDEGKTMENFEIPETIYENDQELRCCKLKYFCF